MARTPRHQRPGAVQHITARSNRGMPLFEDRVEHQLFLEILWRTIHEFGWCCLSYCLMPNHFHLLLRLEKGNLSAGMQRLCLTWARRYNDRRARYGHVFQGRFASSLVDTDSHLYSAIRYIALNPVRAGLCAAPVEFAWSAHRALVDLDPPRLVAVEETWRLFGVTKAEAVAGYEALVADRDADREFALTQERIAGARGRTPPELAGLAASMDADELITAAHLEHGYSFAAIGRALGRNRSSVARRFAKVQAARATRGT